jgi:hypothetical protein
MSINKLCPNCGSIDHFVFYEIYDVPVNSVILLKSYQEAIQFPKGNIVLTFCNTCSFVFNQVFDPQMLEYSSRYESTQSFSQIFNQFHRDLAKRLITRFNMYHKKIVEIGCGQGEFLALLCQMGSNQGIGFDPVVNETNTGQFQGISVRLIKDFYSDKYDHIQSDFICCKMTLEHIQKTNNFIKMIRRTIGDNQDPIVFFQIPDSERIFREIAFWDIYYEHCSYFNLQSLSHLFRRNGFKIIELEKGFDDQYLMITAKPSESNDLNIDSILLEDNKKIIQNFINRFNQKINSWKNTVYSIHKEGKKIAIWGASSKAVAFLSTLGIREEIEFAVDINPNKHNTYLAGSGHRIVLPDSLVVDKPDVILVMNPIYAREIELTLDRMNVKAELIAVE